MHETDKRRRVVVTGMGAVTPVGLDTPSTWESLVAGRSGIGRVEGFETGDLDVQIGGQVKDFDPTLYMDKKEARRLDRFLQFAVASAKQAAADANLTIDEENAENVGVVIGSGIGGINTLMEQAEVLLMKGPDRVSPFLVPLFIQDMASGIVSIHLGAKGPNWSVVSACATSAHCIGESAEVIRRGDAEVMIAGGAEASVSRLALSAFASMRALSRRNDEPERASRPFDKDRDGFVLAEASGIVVLESLEHAEKRGARIYAEVAGYGATGDAHHMTAPSEGGEGAARSMRMALRKAGMQPSEIGYINAHGTSTPYNDRNETQAIKTVFGEHAPPVSSTKSMTGHLIGAAGSVEFIACVLAINEGCLPPTINYETPDPDCDLDYVPNVARPARIDAALSNSLGFGGHNSTLIARRYVA